MAAAAPDRCAWEVFMVVRLNPWRVAGGRLGSGMGCANGVGYG